MTSTIKTRLSVILIIALVITSCCFALGSTDAHAATRYISKVSLSKYTFTYNGNKQGPNITVYDNYGKVVSSSNYDISGVVKCSGVGSHTIRVIGKNGYIGSASANWKTTLGSLQNPTFTVNKKKATVKFKLPYCSKAYVYVYKNGVQQASRKTYKKDSGSKTVKYSLKNGRYVFEVVAYAPVCSANEKCETTDSIRYAFSGTCIID